MCNVNRYVMYYTYAIYMYAYCIYVKIMSSLLFSGALFILRSDVLNPFSVSVALI